MLYFIFVGKIVLGFKISTSRGVPLLWTANNVHSVMFEVLLARVIRGKAQCRSFSLCVNTAIFFL